MKTNKKVNNLSFLHDNRLQSGLEYLAKYSSDITRMPIRDEDYVKFEVKENQRWGNILFDTYDSDMGITPVAMEYSTSLIFSQLKRIPLPFNISSIQDGIDNNIVSKLYTDIRRSQGIYKKEKKLQNIYMTTKSSEVTDLMILDVNAKIKEFILDTEFEFGISDKALDYYAKLPRMSLQKNHNILSNDVRLYSKLYVNSFTVNYDDIVNADYNRSIDALKSVEFGLDDKIEYLDSPIYIDLFTNSCYFIQNINIEFVGQNSSEYIKDIHFYCDLVNNFLTSLHHNIKYKLDNKFTFNKKQSDILKLASKVSNIGVYTQYNNATNDIDLLFRPENAYGLNITAKDIK